MGSELHSFTDGSSEVSICEESVLRLGLVLGLGLGLLVVPDDRSPRPKARSWAISALGVGLLERLLSLVLVVLNLGLPLVLELDDLALVDHLDS